MSPYRETRISELGGAQRFATRYTTHALPLLYYSYSTCDRAFLEDLSRSLISNITVV